MTETTPEPLPPAAAEHRPPLRGLLLGNLLAAMLVAALAWLALASSLDSFKQRSLDATTNLARSLQQAIGTEIARIDIVLQALVLDDAAAAPDLARLEQLLAAHQTLLPEIEGLRVADADGRVLFGRGVPPGAAVSVAERDFFVRARNQAAPALVVSEPHLASIGQRWVVVLARRLHGTGGEFRGVVYAAVSVEHFHRMLRAVDIGPRGAISLRSASLKLVARHSAQGDPAAGIGSANVSPELRAVLERSPQGGSYFAKTALDKVERANSFQRVGDHPLIVLVGLATDDFLGPWRREVAVVSAVAALAVAVLALSSLFVTRAWRREQAVRQVMHREAQLQRAFMQTASDGIHVLDRSGRLVQLSDSFAAMLGYERDEMLGMPHSTWDPRYLEPERIERFRNFQVGGRYRFTTRHRRKDGTMIDVEVVSVGTRLEGQEMLFCASRDVSERERTVRALRASESLLDRTGRLARVGGWELDLRTSTMTWSDQVRRIVEVDAGFQPTPEDGLRFYEPEARLQVEAAVRAATTEGTPWDLELAVVTERGRRLWVRTVGEVEMEDGQPARLRGAVQDITERRQRTVELEREREMRAQTERHAAELDALLRERSEMLDVLAHEVRQPLNNASAAMQSMAKALPEAGDDAAALRLARAQTVMGQVIASIDNTLAAAALLARTDPIQRDDTDVDTLVAVAIGDMPAAERGRIRVHRETSTRTASMDMSLLRLALRNLLSNALKYSPPEGIVDVTLRDSDEPLALLIDVADAGPGVDADLVPRLFERGTRSQRPNAPPGHGLGLYIVRRVMELHGGRVALVRNGPSGATLRLVVVQAPDDD